MYNDIPKHIFRFITLILLQVYVLNNFLFLNIINPYVYIYFILLLPFNIPNFLSTILGFSIGIAIDYFTGSLAINAIASTFLGFLRPFILKLFAPFDGYEPNTKPTIEYYGLSWWLSYSSLATFIHHTILFFSETFNFHNIFFTFGKIILSSFFTILLMTLFQYLFNKTKSQ